MREIFQDIISAQILVITKNWLSFTYTGGKIAALWITQVAVITLFLCVNTCCVSSDVNTSVYFK